MKQKKHRPAFFQKLEQQWYAKLSRLGFDDIENTLLPNRPLKSWHNFRFKNKTPEDRLAIEAYYDEAKDLLLNYSFKNETHKKIWELHCQGFSKRKIEKQIAKMKKPYKRESIGLIINKIAESIKNK